MADISAVAERHLQRGPRLAHLATCGSDRPRVAPVWYRYEDGVVEVVVSGRKLDDLRENPYVSLSVVASEDGLPEWTVSVRGTATVVEDEAAFREANREINEKYGVREDAWSENTLVRIEVGSASFRSYEDDERGEDGED